MGICSLHWLSDYPTFLRFGKSRPRDVPSVWPGIPKSVVPTPPAPSRSTKQSSTTVRSHIPDEIDLFLQQDVVDYERLKASLLAGERNFVCPVTSYEANGGLVTQSLEFNLLYTFLGICILKRFTSGFVVTSQRCPKTASQSLIVGQS